MVQINSISLVQFKNYVNQRFEFRSRIIAISGANGVGKTNLLDAIYYLSFTKSYFNRTDAASVHAGSSGFRLEGHFEKNDEGFHLLCILRESGKKEFSVNDDTYEKLSLHIGRFPCVFVAPDDVRIITEGSEERRRYVDAILSQTDAEYLQRLMNYNRILQQRNSYLKSISDNRSADTSLLDVYDDQLAADGKYIFNKRQNFLADCLPLVKSFYHDISGSDEDVDIIYESQLLKWEYAELLRSTRDRDLYLQRTTSGIHKDDLQILLNKALFKNMASQGQRKSLLFALKLSEFETLKTRKGFAPLLLLDDVFEKLDESRMHNLLKWVCLNNSGQIFITDTHKSRIAEHMQQLHVSYQQIDL